MLHIQLLKGLGQPSLWHFWPKVPNPILSYCRPSPLNSLQELRNPTLARQIPSPLQTSHSAPAFKIASLLKHQKPKNQKMVVVHPRHYHYDEDQQQRRYKAEGGKGEEEENGWPHRHYEKVPRWAKSKHTGGDGPKSFANVPKDPKWSRILRQMCKKVGKNRTPNHKGPLFLRIW